MRTAKLLPMSALFGLGLLGAVTGGGPAALMPPADGLIALSKAGWPQWRGPRRDGVSDETGLLQSWPEAGPPLFWKADGLGTGWSSPITAGARLVVTGDIGEDLVITALDLSGHVLWTAKNGMSWTGSYPGARASCTYVEGRLYHMNAHGRLACLAVETGQELWAVDILDRFEGENVTWGISENVVVDGPRVIVTPCGKQALMAALHSESGTTLWTTPALADDPVSYSSPILFRFGGRRILANHSSNRGFGVDAETGQLLWAVAQANRFQVNASPPVYHDGHVFYVTTDTQKGRQYRLHAGPQGVTAELAWTSPLDSVTGGATLGGGVLYSAGYRRDKWWFGIDWATGATRYELKEFTTGSALFADGRLYVLDQEGWAGLLEPGPDRLEVRGRFRLVEGRAADAWAHPTLCGGRLYLRYHDTLWCFDVQAR